MGEVEEPMKQKLKEISAQQFEEEAEEKDEHGKEERMK